MLLVLWHSSPVLLWHLRLESQLRGQGDGARLRSELERPLSGAEGGWSEVVAGELALRAPLASGEHLRCGACAVRCLMDLEGGGTLAIFDAPPTEAYREALDLFAPDAGDISLLRSVAANWRTIDALTDRVRVRPPPPPSFRYVGEGSRGVVTEFAVGGKRRYVIYAYGHGEHPSRVVGLTGVSRAYLLSILGGLRVDRDRAGGDATCSSARAPRGRRFGAHSSHATLESGVRS